MDDRKYSVEKTYRVVRLRLIGYSMSVPYRCSDGGIACRKIDYEKIDFGGKTYLCAKDHQEQVIYIDTHAVEENLEKSSGRCGKYESNRGRY